MKLGIGLVIWGLVTAAVVSFVLGMLFVIDFGTGEFALDAGELTGLWLVFGGIPLFFGIRSIRRRMRHKEVGKDGGQS